VVLFIYVYFVIMGQELREDESNGRHYSSGFCRYKIQYKEAIVWTLKEGSYKFLSPSPFVSRSNI
jgi:hypothetical protein